ncbi:hypothetical protein EMA8858_04158 [Emticicia aquatica]|uniref:Uncharacterized protein n=1 Tax=Emticicia aquatica TaxID=1681835 RepID=A0ABM9AVF4_9BACT|nr:hypothetical protein [Emticicia aquatica]CAH0998023.1 hypothetical protein EMA8858_04158 [Emticicia aquatica]
MNKEQLDSLQEKAKPLLETKFFIEMNNLEIKEYIFSEISRTFGIGDPMQYSIKGKLTSDNGDEIIIDLSKVVKLIENHFEKNP